MSDILDKIKALFSQSEEKKAPVIHEMIERSDSEQISAKHWVLGERGQLLFNNIQVYLEEPQSNFSNFHLYKNERSNGFAIYFEGSGMQNIEMQYYFDSLKEAVLELPYNLYMSDRKIISEKDSVVKTIERHYLKPERNIEDEKTAQLFGNIAIEHHLRDDTPEFVKINANYYQDHLYHKAKPFPELLEHIFKKS